MKYKYTTLEKVGLILFGIGLLLTITTILIAAFKADILLGILILGLFITIIGSLILLKE